MSNVVHFERSNPPPHRLLAALTNLETMNSANKEAIRFALDRKIAGLSCDQFRLLQQFLDEIGP